jgi:hypothetical protein
MRFPWSVMEVSPTWFGVFLTVEMSLCEPWHRLFPTPYREGTGTVMPGPGRPLGGERGQQQRRQRVARRRRRLALEHQQVQGPQRGRPQLPKSESKARAYCYYCLIGGRCDAACDYGAGVISADEEREVRLRCSGCTPRPLFGFGRRRFVFYY